MKRQIRSRVWETNSSSTHVVYCEGEKFIEDDTTLLKSCIEYDGYLHIKFGEFGWEVKDYTDCFTKLQYALTMVAETECGYRPMQSEDDTIDFEKTEGFIAINDLIADKLDCAGVIIDSEMELVKYDSNWNKGVTMIGLSHDGYIDHQSSTDDYSSLQDFLDRYALTLEGFIFDENVVLHTDNDNRYEDDYE